MSDTHDWGRTLVVWSGGADSTYVLNHFAGISSEDYPIIAISFVDHPNLGEPFMQKQAVARKKYLAWAKRRGYHIKSFEFEIRGTFDFTEDCLNPQPAMWMSLLNHVVQRRDRVLMGYIKRDTIWHYKHELLQVFDAVCKLKGATGAALQFPVEWDSKVDILRKLKKDGVPNTCWFTCESTKDGKACGKCAKCEEVADARARLRAEEVADKKRSNRQITVGKQ